MYIRLQYQVSNTPSQRKLWLGGVDIATVKSLMRGKSIKAENANGGVLLSYTSPITYDYISIPKDEFFALVGNEVFEGVCRKLERHELMNIFSLALKESNKSNARPFMHELVNFSRIYNQSDEKHELFLTEETSELNEGVAVYALLGRLQKKVSGISCNRLEF
ncbi:hypothetical protein [Vibrio sp. D431a]|uniref:hypothetical protein n=1 Tax=Vibrio sp. D431a TaxID=2837388 RepID=UPI002555A40C|nr:hypothetical protein [Vibrio sp. D431a]MDK9790084.1 hypothetical protein [Vibrio sp. D431a]